MVVFYFVRTLWHRLRPLEKIILLMRDIIWRSIGGIAIVDTAITIDRHHYNFFLVAPGINVSCDLRLLRLLLFLILQLLTLVDGMAVVLTILAPSLSLIFISAFVVVVLLVLQLSLDLADAAAKGLTGR